MSAFRELVNFPDSRLRISNPVARCCLSFFCTYYYRYVTRINFIECDKFSKEKQQFPLVLPKAEDVRTAHSL
jgi:hypothetical protein